MGTTWANEMDFLLCIKPQVQDGSLDLLTSPLPLLTCSPALCYGCPNDAVDE